MASPVERLFVIVGAGASADCATDFWRSGVLAAQPPLVKDLFGRQYARTLDEYPVAQMVAADLEGLQPEALVLEEHIRERYRDSDHPLDRLKFLALAPYLQDLLFRASQGWARSPDNHNRLLTALLRLDDVVFVSLNYDTLLDDRLSLLSPIENLNDYIGHHTPNWSLIKLHGSVNWGRGILTEPWSFQRPSIDLQLEDQIRFRLGVGLDHVRQDLGRSGFVPWQFYPAVSVPVGQADEIACPQPHLDFLKEKIATSFDGVDLLVIGYSANDREVLSLLREAGRPLRSLAVVNQDLTSAAAVADRLQAQLRPLASSTPYVFDGRYSSFATEGELAKYISWLRSRPSRAVAG